MKHFWLYSANPWALALVALVVAITTMATAMKRRSVLFVRFI
jgi:hypothetical protein